MSSDPTPRQPGGDPSLPRQQRPGSGRLLSVLAAAGALGCVAVYGWIEGLLPRGPQEFAHFPFVTDPLPFAPMRGFTFEQLVRHLGRTFILGPALLLLAFAVARTWRLRPPGPALRRPLLIAAVGASLAGTALVMAAVLEGRAIVDDELTYRHQAEILASGRLAEDTIPPWGWEAFTIWTRIGGTGKYLFGEPLVQIPGTLLELPALLHLLLAPLALWAWHRSVRFDVGAEAAFWATALVALSPMFILTNALALSHTTTLTCLTLAGLGYQWTRHRRPISGALLAGTALGFGLTVRPQVIVPIGLVLGMATLIQLVRAGRRLAAAALVASGSLWLLLIAAYNQVLSGSPLTLPWYLYSAAERFGFGEVGGVDFVHTPWTAVENLLVVVVRFNGWWLGWPLSLGLIAVWLAVGRPRDGARLWLLGGAALIVMNAPYYSTGISDTGPIYYFELLLPAALLGAHAIRRGLERWPRAAAALLVVHFAVGTTSFLWQQVGRLDRLVTTIHGPVEAMLEQIEPPALLIHENHWRESMRFGWLWSFPKRFRSDDDPIVTLPRGHARFVSATLKRFAGRDCWYYRRDPANGRQQLRRCQDAMELLLTKRQPGSTLRIPSTAERLGLIDLDDTYMARRRAAEREVPASDATASGTPGADAPASEGPQ